VRAEIFRQLATFLAAERRVALATVLAAPTAGAPRAGAPSAEGTGPGRQMLLTPEGERRGSLGSPELDDEVARRSGELLAARRSERFQVSVGEGEWEIFIDVHLPRPRLVIVGAVHTAIPLLTLARTLGFATAVVDPRGVFATRERFAEADALIREWPDEAFEHLPLNEATAVVLLSHDLKLDLPALKIVLASPVFYIGALGSKKTHEKRVRALAEAGFGPEEIGRIHAPVGLDLGGRAPEEIALAILAEIVAVGHGRRGGLTGKGEA